MPGTESDAPVTRIPVVVQSRVIVDNDFAGDPDGLFGLAHHLLVESAEVTGVTCTRMPSPGLPPDDAARTAQALAGRVIDLARPEHRPPIYPDTTEPFRADADFSRNLAAVAIVAAAHTDDARPLYVACGGPLTNVAAALALDPAIADRMTLVWIGGNEHDLGGWEYNLTADLAAARYVFNETTVPIWQFPESAYRHCMCSVAELEQDVAGCGELGAWLYEQYTTPPSFITMGDAVILGDSPLVVATALGSASSAFVDRPRPRITEDLSYEPGAAGTVRVYTSVDARLMIADFIARLRLLARRAVTATTNDETGEHPA